MLHILFYALIAILILSFFGISLQSVVHSPQAQTNFAYVGALIHQGWMYVEGFYYTFIDYLSHIVH